MKRSKAVPLLMLGTLTLLTACESREDVTTRQNSYRSVEDCKKDWGNDDKDCTSTRHSNGMFIYMGPRYIYNHGMAPMAINNDGSRRALPNSYLNRPGSKSTATHATSTKSSFSSGSRSGGSGYSGGRGGFGGSAHGFSGGG